MRLDKMLAHMGYGSRREIRGLVKAGEVLVNGLPAKDVGMQIQEENDQVLVYGEEVIYSEYVYYMMNKPPGVISATEDKHDETVIDLLDPLAQHFEVFPVGRLDKDTEGLLILTNDGKLSHQLLSPKKHVPKTYFAKVEGVVSQKDIDQFAKGVILDDGYETKPAKLTIVQAAEISEIELIIVEGKFHQVKRMFEAVGKKVVFLKRIQMGELSLDPELELGDYRELSKEEVEILRNSQPIAF
ncbi:pseudouridine synthase [Paenisporosarcina cavernae]|uniref:Pseudouridine synthase n=1 Tax=Paenisporosarcina cavernae TaxID=2320858 RepID=A0A385YVU0_9BACL|nr:pseudouridine synthase [Paenisporosarcina cavernae]AYC30806.1 rRNA pseudouridine synthase [Paenisporosarcina cavernae]